MPTAKTSNTVSVSMVDRVMLNQTVKPQVQTRLSAIVISDQATALKDRNSDRNRKMNMPIMPAASHNICCRTSETQAIKGGLPAG